MKASSPDLLRVFYLLTVLTKDVLKCNANGWYHLVNTTGEEYIEKNRCSLQEA